jgi:hypothetical protein
VTKRRVLWVVVAVVVVAAAFVAMSIPRFANTKDQAYEVQQRSGGLMTEQAAASAPAGFAADASAPDLRLPGASELQAEVPADSDRLLIRTGEMSIEVETLDTAVAAVAAAVRAVGGFVTNTSTFTTDAQRQATIETKVPAARFDAAVERLRAVGEVQSVQVSVQDVGEEYTDVAARMANARRLETRLINLLATRTGRLEDVLNVERELARVREEVERYAGRLQYLRQHAALSTLTVRLYEPGSVVGSEPVLGVIADAFAQAWRNFVALVAFLIQALGVVVPLGVLAWLGWQGWKRFGRRDA